MIEGFFYAPREGFEPTTQRLTVACAAPVVGVQIL